ncbi:MAG: cell envelope integrity protein CreD [Pseudomonadales bacterium]
MTAATRRYSQTTVRFALIGAIVLAMLIPLALVKGVSRERQALFDATLTDVGRAWGEAQSIAGPFLIIPEEHHWEVADKQGRKRELTRLRERVFLPSDLSLDIEVDHQLRSRGIYEVPVYTARVSAKGRFDRVDDTLTERSDVRLRTDQARIVVGISHTQAVSTASTLALGDAAYAFRAGTENGWIGTGVQASIADYVPGRTQSFEFEVVLKGTRQLDFAALGGRTSAHMTASWPHPSFQGRYLPERYAIRSDGFDAQWTVHELARALPATFMPDEEPPRWQESAAAVRLFQPVTGYTTVDRAIKYGLLFVVLTFLGFICFELTQALRFHPVQYGVVGLGLVLFYLALLALSEHLSFALAYLIATTLVTALTTWYAWAMARAVRPTIGMAITISTLYATLYVLLQLETFALLVGTGVLFIGLWALMFSTRALAMRVD